MLLAEASWHGLPLGDWVTWAGSVAVSLSFIFLAYGTVVQAREARRQIYLDESAGPTRRRMDRPTACWREDRGPFAP